MNWNPALPALAAALPLLLACGGGIGGSPVAPPTAVKVTQTSYLVLEVAWQPSEGKIDFYELQGRFAPEAWGLTSRLPKETTSIRIGVTAAEFTDVSYRVRAWFGTSYSPWSTEATVRIGLAPAENLHAWPDRGGLGVYWGNPSRYADTLLVERGTSPAATTPPAAWTAMPNLPYSPEALISVVDTDVVEGLYHQYRVTYSKGADHASALAAPHLVTLACPTGIQASATGGTVHLTWRNRSQAATGIRIARANGKDATQGAPLATLAPTATSFDDVDLLPGNYTYFVSAAATGDADAQGLPCVVQVLPPSGVWPFTDALVTLPLLPAVKLAQDGSWWLAGEEVPSLVIQHGTTSGWTKAAFTRGSAIPEPQLLLDGQGRAHLIHTADDGLNSGKHNILHTWLSDSGWTTETIGSRLFANSHGLAAALDAAGSPRLALNTRNDSHSDILEHAFKGADGNWVIEKIVHPALDTPWFTSRLFLKLAPDGTTHVVVGETASAAVLRRSPEGPWESVLDKDTGAGAVCAAEFTGAGHLRLLRNRGVVLASTWETEFSTMDFKDGAWTPAKHLATVPYLAVDASLVASRDGERFAYEDSNSADRHEVVLLGPGGIERFQVGRGRFGFAEGPNGRLWILAYAPDRNDGTAGPVGPSGTYRCYLEKP
ncbi:fibronectin type III domain-containing protein [Geothrix sp. 21YS21S-2]|uniref:fibronectin type III domain-containing protein n=1 Tax=Geothrix sp. 21YS21S-2 TaxID=3068893 RepID=UPI0027B90B41|nr:fibronectin type III domain-containing protein [Geothrix sp. 21YS21S-2]